MRKQTLGSVCFIFALVLFVALKSLASSQGIHLPLVGFVSPLIASFILVPLLLIPFTAINQRILAWRKAHGRDIELEEKHEFDDAGIISLRPREPHEHSSTYRRWDRDN